MPPVTKEEAEKADAEAKAVKEARHAADVEAKRVAEEREATKANLDLILPLRGIARSLSPHGAANLAEALDAIANAIAAGKKPEVLVDVAIALKDTDRNWDAMVQRINDALKPKV